MTTHLTKNSIWEDPDRRNSEVLHVPRFGVDDACESLREEVKRLRNEGMMLRWSQTGNATGSGPMLVDQPGEVNQDEHTLVVGRSA